MSFQMIKCNQVIQFWGPSWKLWRINQKQCQIPKFMARNNNGWYIIYCGMVYIFLFILAISIPLKAFNDQRSKKMIACGEKNTLGSEHSSNISLAVIWNVKLYTFLMKINVCVCHVRYQGVLVLARTFLIAFLSWWWWWHNLCFQILICRFKLAGIWKYDLLHNLCRTS